MSATPPPRATVAGTARAAIRDLGRSWRTLAETDLLYKAIAFVLLTPMIGATLRWFVGRTGSPAIADVDIALFFVTTKSGAAALVLIAALTVAVVALEQACLLTIGLASAQGAALLVRDALAYAWARGIAILQLTGLLVVRVLVLSAPFLLVAGAAAWALVRRHDINYYLQARPPAFWGAAAIVGISVAGLVWLLAARISGWALVLPLVVFERTRPMRAFGESARRMQGRRGTALAALAGWAAAAAGLELAITAGLQALGRLLAPAPAGSLAALLVFAGAWATAWGVLSLAANVAATALFAMIVLRLHLDAGPGASALPLVARRDELDRESRRFRISWKALVAALCAAVVVASGFAYVLLSDAWRERPVLVFAHRGASADAPENTLAAFRLAREQGADFVELDVQESSDGVVLVAHDRDLMKVARSRMEIWSSPADRIRAVDVGSSFSPAFKDERVPTLAEALAVCRGGCRVDIELKDYGHGERLEERVVEVVEAAGMEKSIVTMSLNRRMVETMKRLRPAWTSGLLVANAIGDLSLLPVDFLAVESRMATRSLIRRAHAAGKPVYVWTVDDPQRMVRMIGLGVDGLITNRPALAKGIVARYAAMEPPERLFLFVMSGLGARAEISEPEDDLRP